MQPRLGIGSMPTPGGPPGETKLYCNGKLSISRPMSGGDGGGRRAAAMRTERAAKRARSDAPENSSESRLDFWAAYVRVDTWLVAGSGTDGRLRIKI